MKEIPLTQGKVALVDDEDYLRLSVHKWHARCSHGQWYAWRNIGCGDGGGVAHMHRVVLGLSLGKLPGTDHRNGNGLDNRRDNLRVATNAQNQANRKARRDSRSGLKGVDRPTQDGKWRARIRGNSVNIHLGYFAAKEQAAEAYRRAAEQYFGEFAFHRRHANEGE